MIQYGLNISELVIFAPRNVLTTGCPRLSCAEFAPYSCVRGVCLELKMGIFRPCGAQAPWIPHNAHRESSFASAHLTPMRSQTTFSALPPAYTKFTLSALHEIRPRNASRLRRPYRAPVTALQHRTDNINNVDYSPSLVGSGRRTGKKCVPVRSSRVPLQFHRD